MPTGIHLLYPSIINSLTALTQSMMMSNLSLRRKERERSAVSIELHIVRYLPLERFAHSRVVVKAHGCFYIEVSQTLLMGRV